MYFQLQDYAVRTALQQHDELGLTGSDDGSASSPPSYESGMLETKLDKPLGAFDPAIVVTVDRPKSHEFDIGEMVTGKVVILPRRDAKFGTICIRLSMKELVQYDETFGCVQYTRSVTVARHTVPVEAFPADNTLRAGQRYTIPYLMMIPDKLPQAACPCTEQHCVSHDELLPSHGFAHVRLDDDDEGLYGEPGKVAYHVEAIVTKPMEGDGQPAKALFETKQQIVVQPTTTMPSPPLDVGPYTATQELTTGLIRKSKIGTVEAVAMMPVQVKMGRKATGTDVTLRYTPNRDKESGVGPPPEIKSIVCCADAISIASAQPLGDQKARHGSVGSAGSAYAASVASSSGGSSGKRRKPREAMHKRHRIFKTNFDLKKPAWTVLQDGTMQTTLTLPFVLPVRKDVTQSYMGCITGRQYEFYATFSFVGVSPSVTIRTPMIVSNYRQRSPSVYSVGGYAPSLLDESEAAPRYDGLEPSVSETSSLRTLECPSIPVRRLPTPEYY